MSQSASHLDELILMKLHTVVLYGVRLCMKEDNPVPKNIKGDNSRERIIYA